MFGQILVPQSHGKVAFFEDSKSLNKFKSKRSHKGTSEIPLFGFCLNEYEPDF